MQNNITTLLLGIQDVEVTGVSEEGRPITNDCKSVHDRVYPHCGSPHAWIHDHRGQLLGMLRCDVSMCFFSSRRHVMLLKLYKSITN